MNLAERIFESANQLPEPLSREELDFIGYLQAKGERDEWVLAQQSSLQSVWNNPEDEAWNDATGR